MTGAARGYISVPEHGLPMVLELVRQRLQEQRWARESANGWVGSRRQWRRVNNQELDLMEWFDEVAAAVGADREV